jgi:hypothetical protein
VEAGKGIRMRNRKWKCEVEIGSGSEIWQRKVEARLEVKSEKVKRKGEWTEKLEVEKDVGN